MGFEVTGGFRDGVFNRKERSSDSASAKASLEHTHMRRSEGLLLLLGGPMQSSHATRSPYCAQKWI